MDDNGDFPVVAAFFFSEQEDEQSIQKMIKIFKTWDPQWKDIEVVITDKDMVERSVMKSELPQIHLQICLYHVMRTFSHEVSIEKVGTTSGEKQTVLELLQNITYAIPHSDYDTQYNHILSVKPHM